MKNIFIVPTNKPSRLHEYDYLSPMGLSKEPLQWRLGRELYITSEEEIKEGVDQWYLDKVLNEPYNSGGAQYSSKQDIIILTTDSDLIKDGVQSINDEFLEWFIKNQSCEKVDVINGSFDLNPTETMLLIENYVSESTFNTYKIIIPKEESKQKYEYIGECKGNSGNGCFMDNPAHNCGCFVRKPKQKWGKPFVNTMPMFKIEPEQEALEEAAVNATRNLIPKYSSEISHEDCDNIFKAGAKWQSEKSYSEEDMKQFGLYLENNFALVKGKSIDELFEQFKKKK